MISIVFWETINENTQTYQEKVFILILHQILITKIQGIVWQQWERINNQISGVDGLIEAKLIVTHHLIIT